MITKEQRAHIRRLFYAEHWKVGTISAQLGLHPDAVRRAIEVDRFVSNSRHVPSLLDLYLDFIGTTLEQYPRLRATRVHEMIVERGYQGSVVQTRRAVRRLRPPPKTEAYLRLTTMPGEQGQVDWGSFGSVEVGRARRRLSAFVMVLSWCRDFDALFTLDQTTESFLRGHVEAFDYFEGVPRVLLYDNLKSAVLARVGDVVSFQPRLLDLAAHYHFEPRPVAVARGNEKGRVERMIRFLRDRFFAARSFRDVDDLNAQFRRWREQWAHQRKCPGDEQLTVAEALEVERERLLPLPEHSLCCDTVKAVKSGKTPYVRFDLNDYSIPHELVRKPLTLVASHQTVRLLDGDREVARHPRCWDRRQQIEDPRHLEALVAQKRKARQSRRRDELSRAAPGADAFLEAAVERGFDLPNTVRQLAGLLDQYGADDFAPALDEALARGTPTPSAVALIIEQERRRRQVLPQVPVALREELRAITVTPHRLTSYDPEPTDRKDDDDDDQ